MTTVHLNISSNINQGFMSLFYHTFNFAVPPIVNLSMVKLEGGFNPVLEQQTHIGLSTIRDIT